MTILYNITSSTHFRSKYKSKKPNKQIKNNIYLYDKERIFRKNKNMYNNNIVNEIVNKIISKLLFEHDEYFTQYDDIGSEISHYDPKIFYNKVVMVCCDKPNKSNFWKFFKNNFENLHIPMVVSTFWSNEDKLPPKMTILTKNGVTEKPLRGNGDFLSDEIRNIMTYIDIVVTNPPYSNGMFSKFLQQLKDLGKKFLVIGPTKSGYEGKVFDLLKNNEISIGYNKNMKFLDQMNNGKPKEVQSVWYTNFERPKKGDFPQNNADIGKYQKYDNLNAINVNHRKDIPTNYDGIIGVPPSIIDTIDLNMYDIIKTISNLKINGQKVPKRTLIKRKNSVTH